MVLVSKRRRGLQFLKVIQLFQINHETYCWELAVSTVDLILRGGSTNDTWGAKAYKTFSDHFYHHRVHDKHWQLGEEPSLISLATIDHDSIYDPGSRFATTPPPPTWYGPKTCVLQHSAWKRCICSVFCMVGCWCGPQPCKFVGFLQPTFRKRVICNVSASTSWSSAAAPSSISVSNYHIILNLLLTVFSLGTGLISVYILCLSNFLLECLVFRNWSNLKFS